MQHMIIYSLLRFIGLKIVDRQKNSESQCSRRIESSPREVEIGFGSEPAPIESFDLSVSRSTFQTQTPDLPLDPTVDTHFIIMPSMAASAAFACIVNLLQLDCGQDSGFNIRATDLPLTLAPTSQQQLIKHLPYVDMLPWASLRDRILNSLAVMNEVEFVQDMQANLKIWGSTPWDPIGWEVTADFAKKWWFLMDDSIMQATNFWRGQRGEQALVLARA